MTVIAWDGKTLAADRRQTSGGLITTGHKITPLADGSYYAEYGAADRSRALLAWFQSGADPEAFPVLEGDEDEDKAAFVIVKPDGTVMQCWGDTPVLTTLYSPYHAWGCGREIAIGAMAAGADAYEAVRLTSEHNCFCGNGIDAYKVVL